LTVILWRKEKYMPDSKTKQNQDVKAKGLSVHDDITRAFSELSPSKFKLTDEERKKFERARLSEEQSKKVNYVLGGPVNQFF